MICLSRTNQLAFCRKPRCSRTSSGAKCPARKIRFRAKYQRDLGRPVRARKIFGLCRRANQIQNSRRPASARGAYALSSRNVRRDAMDAGDVEKTNDVARGRRSRVVLTSRRWCQVLEKQASWGRRGQESPVPGESTKETVKTIARGMPGETGVTVVTTLVCSFLFCMRGCGCAQRARHSLRPCFVRG